jgi:L-malate glycosyltransferase
MHVKILFCTHISQPGSPSLGDRMLIKGLFLNGVDITVTTHYRTSESEELEKMGIRIEYFPILKKIDREVIRKLRSILLEEKYDILHLTYGKAVTNGILAARGIKIKIVVFFGSMSVYWHDPSAYLSFLNPRIDKIICISNNVRDHLRRQLPAKSRQKAVRIYRGFDPVTYEQVVPVTRQSLDIPDDAFVISCVATVRKIKGIPYLIKATDFLPPDLPIYIIIVGTDSDSLKIKNLVEKTRYSRNFRLMGEQDIAPAFTAICDLYIQPSITEGLGRAIVEAMSLKKTPIVTDNGGAQELVEEGKSGFVVPAKSAEAIGSKILYCYHNRNSLKAMGENARERINSQFHINTSVNQTIELYYELTGKDKS